MLIPLGFLAAPIASAQSDPAAIQQLQLQISALKGQAIAEYQANTDSARFRALNQEIVQKQGNLDRLLRGQGGFRADQDGNGCVDAGEANQYELVTGQRYTGALCDGQQGVPSW